MPRTLTRLTRFALTLLAATAAGAAEQNGPPNGNPGEGPPDGDERSYSWGLGLGGISQQLSYAGIDRDSSIYYPPGVSKEQAACHLVALLTDLPPRWLFDCATNRRGDMPEKSPVLFPPRADEVR